MIKVKRAGLYYQTIPMGGNQPVTGTEGMELPEYVYYVSPSFSGVSPYFKTISAAYLAADGIHKTTIFVYPGLYHEDIPPKAETHLVGIDKRTVRIQILTTAAINAQYSSGTQTFSVSNVTITSGTIAATGILIVLTGTAILDASFHNVDVATGSLTSGIIVQNNNGLNTHSLVLRGVHCNAPSTSFSVTKPFSSLTIDDCTFDGGLVYADFGGSGPFPSDTIIFRDCKIGGSVRPNTNAIIGKYRFYGCEFTGAITPSSSGELVFLNGCQFFGQSLVIASSGTGTYDFQDCTFDGTSGSDTVFISNANTGNFIKLYNCTMTNGRISFGASNTGLVAVHTVVKNPSGTYAIDVTAGTPQVFLGDFASDKALHASVAQVSGSYDVNVSVAI